MEGGEAGTWVPQVIFGWDAMWVATALLVLTYTVIITERVNRAIVALIGAGLMIQVGVLDQAEAVRGIDFNTIALLTGMMVIVAITRKCGVFQYVAIWSAQVVKADPRGVLIMLAVVTAVFSALLDNVTTVLLVAPVTLLITEELKVNPYPVLFAEIFASNIGGTATLIGDPPNIIIGSAAGLTYNDFVINLTPVIVPILAVTIAIIHLVWRRQLVASPEARQRVMQFVPREAITDRRLLKQSLFVLALIIVAFVLARPLDMEPGSIAMLGAALLLLLDNFWRGAEDQSRNTHATFGEVEWIVIFFFIGLFIIVHGVDVAGVLALLGEELVVATKGDLAITAIAVLWGSAILSAIIDNIPFVATMIPVIKSLAPTFGGADALEPLWWSLSLGACLGGNGSLIGASANLAVAGFAERAGYPIKFLRFLLLAFPLMLVSIVLSTVYVYLVLLP
ncbi:MAG: ArsB/NhaD family transporter [Alphaproteobacteria bacterium]